jgi:VCBS repeat-containing protein
MTIVVSYTVADNHGGTVAQTETITITGTNDQPDIKVVGADSASAAFNETDSGLSTSGTLTVADPDTSDTVDVSITNVAVSGTGGAGTLTAADLKAMLTLTGNADNAGNGTQGSLGWSFNSGTEAFNYLGAGQTLVVTYTLGADDHHSGSDTQTVTVTVTGTNDAPVVDLNGSGTAGTSTSINYTAGTSAVSIAPAGIVTDVDSADFNGGILDVSIFASTTADQLTIFNQGTGAGQIGISGTDVTYGGVVIGSWSGGTNGNALLVTLNANATQAAVTALMEDVRYSNATSPTATKTVNFLLQDGDGTANGGHDIGQAVATINVTGGNQPPVPTPDVIWASNGTTVTLSNDVLLGNDTDNDGLALSLVSVTAPAGALASGITLNPDGTFTFTTGATGGTTSAPTVVTLTYQESDGAGNISTGTVTLNIVATDNTGQNGSSGIDLSGVGAYTASFFDGKAGNDDLTDGTGLSVLIGGVGVDNLTGGAGNDILRGGSGNDNMDGGAGTEDLLDLSDGTSPGITFTLTQSSTATNVNLNTIGLGNDSYKNMEGVIGTNFADNITGSSGNDILRGGGGNDTLDGGAGTGDLIDFTDGAAGIVFTLVQSNSNTVFNTGPANLGTDTYKNMEGVIGTGFADQLTGSISNDIIRGGAGDDTINGNDGNDTLRGDSGNDFILGGNGNDVLNGGLGADTLFGGAGNDTFVFNTALNNVDTINDFEAGGNGTLPADSIQLDHNVFTGLSVGTLTAGVSFFSNTTGAASGTHAQIIFNSATGDLYYDADGTGAQAAILFAHIDPGGLTGTLDPSDFLVV